MGVNNVSGANSNYSLPSDGPKSARQPKIDLGQQSDVAEFSTKPAKQKVGIGKKVGVGIASACIPGLGQLVNGEGKKGAAFLGGAIGLTALATATMNPILAIGALAVEIASVVDAVKNAK